MISVSLRLITNCVCKDKTYVKGHKSKDVKSVSANFTVFVCALCCNILVLFSLYLM